MRLGCFCGYPPASTRASATLQKSVIDLALRSFVYATYIWTSDWDDDDKMFSVGVTPFWQKQWLKLLLSICRFSPNNAHYVRKEWQWKFFPDFSLEACTKYVAWTVLTIENSPCRSITQSLWFCIGLHSNAVLATPLIQLVRKFAVNEINHLCQHLTWDLHFSIICCQSVAHAVLYLRIHLLL
jgi:hypothetical protein